MILTKFDKICQDVTKVENYESAVKDEERWVLHHRLETHTSEGKRREVDLTATELMALDMYYDRPPEELIFLKESDHMSLHISKSSWYNNGEKEVRTSSCPEDFVKGRLHVSETHWYNNGEINIRAMNCPKGFIKGRLMSEEHKHALFDSKKGKSRSEETKQKISKSNKESYKALSNESKEATSKKKSEAMKNKNKNISVREKYLENREKFDLMSLSKAAEELKVCRATVWHIRKELKK